MTAAEFAIRFFHPAWEADDDVIEVGDDGEGRCTVEMADGAVFFVIVRESNS